MVGCGLLHDGVRAVRRGTDRITWIRDNGDVLCDATIDVNGGLLEIEYIDLTHD